MRSFTHSREGNVTAAVEDLWTGRTYVYRPRVAVETASIVKLDILETLLRRHQLRRTPLSAWESATAQRMIEQSDNASAAALWNEVGGAVGVATYNRSAGLRGTHVALAWGLTTTTALDQIRLLRQLVLRHVLLDGSRQRYPLGLMSHIEADQRWGVSAGVPSDDEVALKNGWLPYGGSWHVNSVGRIRGRHRHYLIAVLTSGDPSEAYGVATVEGISAIAYRYTKERGERRFSD
ncbi:MAG TPA: serine hydrolase [Solirubrobacteraceae bacterium]|nr:serine hydrolase [Solirubrobacteraceae bacterium]